MEIQDNRPDPDELLASLKIEEEKSKRGKLKIFFGMCAGVGKTYSMLKTAHAEKQKGIDIIIGYVETHKRQETADLVEGFELIPRKVYLYKSTPVEEMDLDAIIARNPHTVLVDELAHTNAPGSRHNKRYQDVQEILENFEFRNQIPKLSKADVLGTLIEKFLDRSVAIFFFIDPAPQYKDKDKLGTYGPDQMKRKIARFPLLF